MGFTPSDAWFVYVARCADDTIYVGIARDVAARIAAHDAGKGARYTRGRGPLRVLATRRCASKGDALRLELALKKLPRAEKLDVARSPRSLARFARAVATAVCAPTGTWCIPAAPRSASSEANRGRLRRRRG